MSGAGVRWDRVAGNHGRETCGVQQGNADPDLVPVLCLGQLTNVSDPTEDSCHLPGAHRSLRVAHKKMQCGPTAMKKPLVVGKLGGAESQGVTRVEHVGLTRPMQIRSECGQGEGLTQDRLCLPTSQAGGKHRNNGSFPSSLCPEATVQSLPVCLQHFPRCCPLASAQGECL